jgi:hypothetical protein
MDSKGPDSLCCQLFGMRDKPDLRRGNGKLEHGISSSPSGWPRELRSAPLRPAHRVVDESAFLELGADEGFAYGERSEPAGTGSPLGRRDRRRHAKAVDGSVVSEARRRTKHGQHAHEARPACLLFCRRVTHGVWKRSLLGSRWIFEICPRPFSASVPAEAWWRCRQSR